MIFFSSYLVRLGFFFFDVKSVLLASGSRGAASCRHEMALCSLRLGAGFLGTSQMRCAVRDLLLEEQWDAQRAG